MRIRPLTFALDKAENYDILKIELVLPNKQRGV